MRIADKDRCPKCGAPYLGPLAPGETPENRYCYTCDMRDATGNVRTRSNRAANGGTPADLLPLEDLAPRDEGAYVPRHERAQRFRKLFVKNKPKAISSPQKPSPDPLPKMVRGKQQHVSQRPARETTPAPRTVAVIPKPPPPPVVEAPEPAPPQPAPAPKPERAAPRAKSHWLGICLIVAAGLALLVLMFFMVVVK